MHTSKRKRERDNNKSQKEGKTQGNKARKKKTKIANVPANSQQSSPPVIILDSDDDDNENNLKNTTNKEEQPLHTTTNKISLTERDLQTLRPREWLNDTIIDFTLAAIEDEYQHKAKIYVSNSFFFIKLHSAKERHKDLYGETKAWVDIKKIRRSRTWFIPVCHRHHWFLIAVVFPLQKNSLIYVMDSLNKDRSSEAGLIIDFLNSFHLAEAKVPLSMAPRIYQHEIPQQHNMNDCGLHLIRSFELSIIRRKFIIALMQGNITDQAAISAFWKKYPVMSRCDVEYRLLKYVMEHSTN